jgi:hypothetical protein
MKRTQRWLQVALLTPSLACGGAAKSGSHEAPAVTDTEQTEPGESSDGPGMAPVAEGTAARGGQYCPDGVYPDSIDIDNQTELDRLSGCERIDGSLVLRIFPGIDEAPLSSLRDVNGGVEVYGAATTVRGQQAANPLAGFIALEETTHLRLQGLSLSDLEPLARLKHIGAETSPLYSVPVDARSGGRTGALEIVQCTGLSSLRGLGALESVLGIVLQDNPDLQSLAGLQQLDATAVLRSTNCPLLDLAGLSGIALSQLEIEGSALTRLDGLGDASALSSLRLQRNPSLVSLEGGQMPESLIELVLADNQGLLSLSGLQGLHSAQTISISSGEGVSELRSLDGLSGLQQVGTLQLLGQSSLTDLSGLDALEHASELAFYGSSSLVSVQGLAHLTSADRLSLTGSPALASLEGLGSAAIGELYLSGMIELELSGLERGSISSTLAFSDVQRVSAPAGLPQLAPRADLVFQNCPELRDLQAFAPLTSLGSLSLTATDVENLDALAQLDTLRALSLHDNPRLEQVDALSGVSGLQQLIVAGNGALLRLPVFANADCGSCSFDLQVVDNPVLQTGPGLPGVARASGVLVSGNTALTSLSGLSTLQSVQSLAVERNPRLVELPLPELQQADVLAIHANAGLDDTALTALRQLPGASSVKIVSNLSGPAQLASCPWLGDGVCDELLGDCAAGSDAFDCGPTLRD